MIPAQELVEHGLAAAGAGGADGCVVLVEEASHADVRFALNTTTTNGVHRARTVSVIVVAGESVGTARRAGVVGTDGVARDGRRPRWPTPGQRPRRRTPLPSSSRRRHAPARDFSLAPEETDAAALECVLSSLSGAFGRARARDAVLAGFAEIDVATLYLGSSTGVRLSHAQPTAAVNLVGTHRRRDGVGLGRRAGHRPVARGDGAGDLAPPGLGEATDRRSMPGATR